MKCPKCGCGIKQDTFCPYCKITADEVRFASNNEAKKRIKEKETDGVYTSSYIPYDVSKWKLFFITLFGGVFGFDAYYLGRYKRAVIQFATFFLAFVSFTLKQYFGFEAFALPTDILTLICAVFVVMWIGNVIGVAFNKATVPVVLPTKAELVTRQQEWNDSEKAKADAKEAKRQKRYDKMVEKEKKNIEKEEAKKKSDEK